MQTETPTLDRPTADALALVCFALDMSAAQAEGAARHAMFAANAAEKLVHGLDAQDVLDRVRRIRSTFGEAVAVIEHRRSREVVER